MAYRDVEQEEFSQRNEVAQSRRTGDFADYWSPQAGPAGSPKKNRIRVLPPHEDMLPDPFLEVVMHYFPSREMNAKTGRPIMIGLPCRKQFGTKECEGCENAASLAAQSKGADDPEDAARLERQAKDRSAGPRIHAQIVDMDHPEKGVQRWAFGPGVEKWLRMCFYDDDQQWRNITHPKTGRDILLMVQKKFKSDFNDYNGTRAAESVSKLPDMAWLDKIEDLSVLKWEPSTADFEMALRGERPPRTTGGKAAALVAGKEAAAPKGRGAREEIDDNASPPGKRGGKPSSSKRQAVAEEPEEPFAAARKIIAEFTGTKFKGPIEITLERSASVKKPGCYMQETDPADPMCQGCLLLLPCLQSRIDEETGAAPWIVQS